jgi:dGTPase
LQTGFADPDLVEAICLAHDIGHPPFGHAGEEELQRLMENSGGFEANAQNLRVLTYLEVKSGDFNGLNLTRATLDGVLKYKTPYSEARSQHEKKFSYDENSELVGEISQGITKKTFECEIMDWADEVAYSVHDMEDGIKAGMISLDTLGDPVFRRRVENSGMIKSVQTFSEDWTFVELKITEALAPPGKQEHERKKKAKRKELVADLIDYFVRQTMAKRVEGLGHSRYDYSVDVPRQQASQCALLKAIVWQAIINDEKIATLERKACIIVRGLFEEFHDLNKAGTEQMYPYDFRERFDTDMSDAQMNRIACDYIAGMTDAYAMRVYSRLRQPEVSSVFEML